MMTTEQKLTQCLCCGHTFTRGGKMLLEPESTTDPAGLPLGLCPECSRHHYSPPAA